ncbi:MAG: hypothetical protein ACRDJH_01500 [Thermomicrobiales bacterium]
MEANVTPKLVALKSAIGEIDLNSLVLSFDRESDALMVHLYGRGQPGISHLVTDEFMIRFDPNHEKVIGIQIEHFLSLVVPEHPRLLDALDIAELRGISLEEVAQIRREVATNQKRETLDEVIAEFPPFDSAAD